MKAEDTVIEGGVKQTLKINWSNTITGHLLGWQPTIEPDAQDKFDEFIRQIRLEQAEISFKAGYAEGNKDTGEVASEHVNLAYREGKKAGRMEVVDWIKTHSGLERCDPDVMPYFIDYLMVDYPDWQAELKKWGIELPNVTR